MYFDVVIIGAGAAGLFCAIEAGRRGRRVLVVEHNAEPGRKILISGGGRCNFTNVNTTHENFVSSNPHFAKSALARYTPGDFIKLVREHNIPYYEKKLGQLFCRERSQSIVDMLLAECRRSRVKIETNCTVRSVSKNEKFHIETTNGTFEAESLVIASGGLSFPKIGATNFGYTIAKQFGLKIEPTRPSLVPLMFDDRSRIDGLAGISVASQIDTGDKLFTENILFTHRGLSGPAVLQASNYWDYDREMSIDTLPDIDVADRLMRARTSKKLVSNFLGEMLPARFVDAMFAKTRLNKPLDQLSNNDIDEIGRLFNSWQVRFRDTEGWHKAEVTLGGVSTKELSSQTMEAKKVAGLYFIGEVIDVTGWLGGYNFQWAWASSFAAGQAV